MKNKLIIILVAAMFSCTANELSASKSDPLQDPKVQFVRDPTAALAKRFPEMAPDNSGFVKSLLTFEEVAGKPP